MSRMAGIALQCGHRFKSRVQHQVGSRAGQPLCLHCDGDKPRDLPGKPLQSGFDLRLDSGFFGIRQLVLELLKDDMLDHGDLLCF